MANAWINHLKAYQAKHPNKSYKQCMKDAKPSYKGGKQSGGNPAIIAAVSKGADVIGSALNLGGEIGNLVHDRRDKSGFFDAEKRNRAVKDFNHLKWQRDRALLPRNRIPKSWSDAQLRKLSGLSQFIG
jgi:hypothetical protein